MPTYFDELLDRFHAYLRGVDDALVRDAVARIDWNMAARALEPHPLPCVDQLDRIGEHLPRQLKIAFGTPIQKIPALQIIRVSFDVIRRRLADRLLFLRQQFHLELLHDRTGNFVLDGENIGQIAIKARY